MYKNWPRWFFFLTLLKIRYTLVYIVFPSGYENTRVITYVMVIIDIRLFEATPWNFFELGIGTEVICRYECIVCVIAKSSDTMCLYYLILKKQRVVKRKTTIIVTITRKNYVFTEIVFVTPLIIVFDTMMLKEEKNCRRRQVRV